MSQDLVGKVLSTDATVTYDDGTGPHHMIEASNCAVHGDSGGALFSGETAVGIQSGADCADCADGPGADSDARPDRSSWYEPVHRVLSWEGLKVYRAMLYRAACGAGA
ncbi:hypothetical protein [Streptomyces sp. NPDC057052]|uniref:hypothetical protein n=1 Tax=Streptomyces sp. NPDC057052 TaxID=3346010 RepID=UPI00362EC77A